MIETYLDCPDRLDMSAAKLCDYCLNFDNDTNNGNCMVTGEPCPGGYANPYPAYPEQPGGRER